MALKKLARSTFTIFQCGCIAHCITEYIGTILISSGPSMEPTLNSNDFIITESISAKRKRFDHNDIVVFKSNRDPSELVCKRIIGLPGDKIYFHENGVIPAGHVWVEGDNRENSWDSRDYGPIPQGLIIGRVVCKIFPLKDMTMLTVKSLKSQ